MVRDPGAASFLHIARAYRRSGRRDAARAVALRALELEPTSVEGRELLALLHLEAGEHELAGAEWNTVLAHDPRSFEAHRGLGFLALEHGRLADARDHLGSAAALRPGDVIVRQALDLLEERTAADGAAVPSAESETLGSRVRGPIQDFMRETGVRTVLVLNRSGQLLAHQGFDLRYDVRSVATLTAAAHASAHALAEITGADRWTHLHHTGHEKQLFLTPFQAAGRSLVLVAIADLVPAPAKVRLFSERLATAVQDLPGLDRLLPPSSASLQNDLENALRRVLAMPREA